MASLPDAIWDSAGFGCMTYYERNVDGSAVVFWSDNFEVGSLGRRDRRLVPDRWIIYVTQRHSRLASAALRFRVLPRTPEKSSYIFHMMVP